MSLAQAETKRALEAKAMELEAQVEAYEAAAGGVAGGAAAGGAALSASPAASSEATAAVASAAEAKVAAVAAIDAKVAEAEALLAAHSPRPKPPPHKWYVVSAPWLHRWQEYLGSDSRRRVPPPMSSERLLRGDPRRGGESALDYTAAGRKAPRERRAERERHRDAPVLGVDYLALEPPIWQMLLKRYGGGPEISRWQPDVLLAESDLPSLRGWQERESRFWADAKALLDVQRQRQWSDLQHKAAQQARVASEMAALRVVDPSVLTAVRGSKVTSDEYTCACPPSAS